MNILYLEDHKIFAESVVRQFLSTHEVTVVPSLSAARLALGAASFDLLLVDFDLPDGKGDTLVRELRQAGNVVAVIGVSSHDAGNEALLRAGATAVCGKMVFDRIQTVIDLVLPGSPGDRSGP